MEEKQKQQWEGFKDELLDSMDSEYQELRSILDPVFHNKTKYVNGKLMKDCFRHFGLVSKKQLKKGDVLDSKGE